MKRKTRITIIALAGLAIIAVAAMFNFILNAQALNNEAQRYADSAMKAIAATWDRQEILKRVSPEFNAVVAPEDLDKLILAYRRLGAFMWCDTPSGSVRILTTTSQGKTITGVYVAKAEFRTGPATITLSIIKHGDQWQINQINVKSAAFLPAAPVAPENVTRAARNTVAHSQ
jgi:hypothetical protein